MSDTEQALLIAVLLVAVVLYVFTHTVITLPTAHPGTV